MCVGDKHATVGRKLMSPVGYWYWEGDPFDKWKSCVIGTEEFKRISIPFFMLSI